MASSHLMLNCTPATNEAGTTGLADKGSSSSFYPIQHLSHSTAYGATSALEFPRTHGACALFDNSPVRKEGVARIPEGVARIPRDCPASRTRWIDRGGSIAHRARNHPAYHAGEPSCCRVLDDASALKT